MPKLDSKTAKAVQDTDPNHGGDFEPLEPGKYLARLSAVTVADKTNVYGATMWSAEFDNLYPLDDLESKAPGRQWLNLTLPTKDTPPGNYENGPDKWEKYQNLLRGRLSAFFEAFGYTTDSDTDEMIGEFAVITLGIRTIQQGAKAGQRTNEVKDIEPVPEDIDIPEVDGTGDDAAF